MKRVVLVAWVALMLGLPSDPAAQSPAGPRFDVASVKPSSPDAVGPMGMPRIVQQAGGRFIAVNTTLRLLVQRAYADFHDLQIVGGPDWQTSRRFDIQAVAHDPDAGMDALIPMLKTLLAERFHLKVHTEARELPIYALVVAREDRRLGANVKLSTVDCSNADQDFADGRGRGGAGVMALLQAGRGLPCLIMPVPGGGGGSMTMRANGVAMTRLAEFLTPITGRMVTDRTGLSSLFDWELTFDLRAARQLQAQEAASNQLSQPPSDSPTLTTALQEQLGLKLESTRGPVEILVIDSAALPEPD